jgi:hypothetical protein
MAVIAALELSGPAIANGSELPSAITAAITADDMKVAATPVGQIRRERAGEDQQRVGQSERDGQNAGGAAAQNVIERSAQFWTETDRLANHAEARPLYRRQW